MRRAPAVAALLLVVACAHDGRSLRQPSSGQTLSIVTTTTGPTTSVGAKPAAIGSAAATTAGGTAAIRTTVGATAAGAVAPTTTAQAATPTGPFALTMPWADGATIDVSYTCDGGNNRPTVSWANVPVGTAELAVLIEDEDADGFVHWLVAGIPPAATSLKPGGLPSGSVQALNGFGNPGWGGPCPQTGTVHHYRTQLFALSAPSLVTDAMATGAAKAALQQGVVGLATMTGTYSS